MQVGKGLVALLYTKIFIWKALIFLHTEANERKHLYGAVYIFWKVMIEVGIKIDTIAVFFQLSRFHFLVS